MSKKLQLRLIGLAGLLLFVPLFAATFFSPIQVERAARGYIEYKIKHRIEASLGIDIDEARETPLGRLAERLADKHKEQLEALKAQLSGLNERIAATVARMQDLSCTCRNLLRQSLDTITAGKISALELAGPQLQQIIEGNYVEIVSSIMTDVRIFAGANAVVFLMLLVLSAARQDRIGELYVLGLILTASTALAVLFYVFGQNWFFVILQADYMGWAYVSFMLVFFGLFTFIAFAKVREISAGPLGTAAAVVDAATSVVAGTLVPPC